MIQVHTNETHAEPLKHSGPQERCTSTQSHTGTQTRIALHPTYNAYMLTSHTNNTCTHCTHTAHHTNTSAVGAVHKQKHKHKCLQTCSSKNAFACGYPAAAATRTGQTLSPAQQNSGGSLFALPRGNRDGCTLIASADHEGGSRLGRLLSGAATWQ